MFRRLTGLTLLTVTCVLAGLVWGRGAWASPVSWAEGLATNDGTTWTDIDLRLELKWAHAGGDWIDAEGTAQGTVPAGVSPPMGAGLQDAGYVDIPIDALVRAWAAGTLANEGVHLALAPGNNSPTDVSSRETAFPPQLVVARPGGHETLTAVADTSMASASDASSMGRNTRLQHSSSFRSLVRFADVPADATGGTLRLHIQRTWGSGDRILQAFASAPRATISTPPVEEGLLTGKSSVRELQGAPGVYLAEDFADESWRERIYTDAVSDNYWEHVEGLIRVHFLKGNANQPGFGGYVRTADGPQVLHVSSLIRFSPNFESSPAGGGGKLPGLSSKYALNCPDGEWQCFMNGGQGGSPTDPPALPGSTARGDFSFSVSADETNPRAGMLSVGSFTSQIDALEACGFTECSYKATGGVTAESFGGVVRPGQAFRFEVQRQMNTPGNRDGCVRVWVDGRKQAEQCGLAWTRDGTPLQSEAFLNFYYGGRGTIPRDQFIEMDDVVVATSFIGMPGDAPEPPVDPCPVDDVLIEGVRYVCELEVTL